MSRSTVPSRCAMSVHDERVAEFHRLHSSGCFVMPNPWDVGSALALEQMGFRALATTSAGFAWTLGRADKGVGLEETLEHLRAVVDAVSLPGNAGLSIEDSTGDEADPLFSFELAVERVRAARAAIDETGKGVVLTGRSEGFVVGRPDIDDTILRLRAYAEAGADCLYAPRIDTGEHVSAIVAAVAPKPVNLLIHTPFITVAEAAALGVRRISVGGTLARVAWFSFRQAAQEIADVGTFTHFNDLPNPDALFEQR